MTSRDERNAVGSGKLPVPGHSFDSLERRAWRLGARAMRTRVAVACCPLLLLLWLSGCGGPSSGLPVFPGTSPLPPDDPAYPTDVQLKYLGAGGILIQRGADALVTAPFFSNPSLSRVAFGEIKSLPEQVDRFLGSGGKDLPGVTAILVGHAHYDHLMDVPYIKKKYLRQAKIYGSETMKNTLAGDHALNPADIVSVEEGAGTDTKPGTWWHASPRLRFMALQSEHAPIIFHWKFFEGAYREPLPELPTRAYGWREGQTLAYLIDFLSADGSKVEFRIHYQDAASNAPLGFPPMVSQLPDSRPVDLAIVCMPGFDQVKDYPEAIVNRLRPRFVVIVHWENFFELLPDDPRDLRTVPTEDAERFLGRLIPVLKPDGVFKLPAPGAWMRFTP